MNVIDGHVHLDLKKYPDVGKAGAGLLSAMNASGVEKAIVMPDGMDCSSDLVKKACRLYPDRLAGFYMPDFTGKNLGRDELEKALKKGNFKGIKIHPRNQKISLNDPRVTDILKKCAVLKFPVFIDCFPFGNLDEMSYPLAFEGLAKENPALRLIMGHMGGYRALDAFIVAKSNENVFLDVSFTFMYFSGFSIRKDIEYMIRSLGPRRFVYGSDYPHVAMKDSLGNFKKLVKSAGLNNKDSKAIFNDNINSIINI